MISTTRRLGPEWIAFGLVFIAVFSQMHFSTSAGSAGNVEQWVNLTNAVFYGKQDFLFSYGPLYWLTGGATSQYNVYSYWASIIFISLVEAYFWAVLFSLSFRGRGYILLALAYFLFFGTLVLPCAYFLWPLAIVAHIEFSREAPIRLNDRWLVALGIIVGFSLYVRFFYGSIAIVTFGSYYVSRALFERRIRELLFIAAGTIVAYIAFGLLIFHNASSLVDYFVINSQLNFGNSVDMTLDIENSQYTFIAAGLVLLFLNAFALLCRRNLFLTLNALFIVLLKLGFGRTDHYVAYFVIPIAATACVMLFDGSWRGKVLFLFTMGALYFISTTPSYVGAPNKDKLIPGVDFSKSYQQRMAHTYAQFSLPETVLQKIGDASIDVFPYNNEYMFGNQLNYVHRPLFQNYMTLTPKLDQMNQKFFEGAGRPKFVLWTAGIACNSADCNPFEDFDQKYTLSEDPLTVSSVLLNYHVVEQFSPRTKVPSALFEENATHTPYTEEIVSSQPMKLGQWYKVPRTASGVLKLKPYLNLTLAARIRNTLFRGAILKVRYELESGEVREFRVNLLNASNGIWISPLLQNFSLEGPRVKSVMLTTRAEGYFKPEFTADWVRVPIDDVRPTKVKLDAELNASSLADGSAIEQPGTCDGSLDAVDGASPVPARIEASGLLRLQGWLADSAKDGIRFDRPLISLMDSNGKRRFFETHEQDRPDVAAVYHNDALRTSGFESRIDTDGLRGNYVVGLAGVLGNHIVLCPQFKTPMSVR